VKRDAWGDYATFFRELRIVTPWLFYFFLFGRFALSFGCLVSFRLLLSGLVQDKFAILPVLLDAVKISFGFDSRIFLCV